MSKSKEKKSLSQTYPLHFEYANRRFGMTEAEYNEAFRPRRIDGDLVYPVFLNQKAPR